MANFVLWNEDKIDTMFQNAVNDVNKFIMDISKKRKLGFSYRVDQHRFAKDVMNAIKENQILLVQAGVGIGKSMGYIIPILSTFKNNTVFKRAVISTSNIALQQQLLTDINYISKLLSIDIKVEIAKGVKNYACLKKINEISSVTNNSRLKKVLTDLEDEMINKETADRSMLSYVSERDWEKIQLDKRSACSNCNYSLFCLYRQQVDKLSKADIIVTNHAYFVNASRENNPYISNANLYVFDEAHELEDSIRGVNQDFIKLCDMKKDIYYFSDNGFINDGIADNLSNSVTRLFAKIMYSSRDAVSNNVKKELFSFSDYNRVPIEVNRINSVLNDVLKQMSYFIRSACNNYDVNRSREAKAVLGRLENYYDLFFDLKLGKNSKRIYWADFFRDDRINLGYVSKDDYVSIMNIFKKKVPIVCTSATMLDANGSYNYFKEGLHFSDMGLSDRTIVDGRVYDSPYNYYTNSVFYYDNSVSSPYSEKYIDDLVDRISELISITEGKTLVLFTAKSTMNTVYERVAKKNLGYNLLLQGKEDNSVLLEKFNNDVNSCLFGTGPFWEGIDVKGESLSNVIITRLPFPVVDAVTQIKASKYSKEEEFRMVYLNDMVQKMAQGSGRLIRGKNDYGVVCCLDSRCSKYLDYIKRCVPFEKYTTDINDVIKFSDKKIKKLGKKQEN